MYFEREQVQQVALNLLENACKFTPKTGQIEIKGYPYFWERRAQEVQSVSERNRRHWDTAAPNAYRVDVSNTGSAIPPDRLDRIFEEYTTYGGAGPTLEAAWGWRFVK